MQKPPQGAHVDRGRRILVHCAVAIATGLGAWSLDHGPEPVRASGLSPSVAVPVIVPGTAKRKIFYLAGPEAEHLVVNGRYTNPPVTVNEPPAPAIAKQSRSS